MPTRKAQEESLGRLHELLPRMPKIQEAVDEALRSGRFEAAQFGIDPKRLGGGFESMAGNNALGFEAIVRRVGRPPLLIRNNQIVFEPLPDLPIGEADVRQMDKFVPSVGRVEFINHDMSWGGTGFVIDEAPGGRRRVVTNRHVAKLVAKRTPSGAGIFMRSPTHGALYGALLDMREEVGSAPGPAFELPVVKIVYLADDAEADVALLEIEVKGNLAPDPLPLANRATQGEPVATIGYPAFDDRNGLAEMRAYFKDLYNVKRFAPGLVISRGSGTILSHDCTTLGGNSGSCLLSIKQGGVVGLHFSGEFGVSNAAVSVETLKTLLTGRLIAVGAPALSPEEEAARSDGEHTAADLRGRDGYDPHFLGDGTPGPLSVPWPTFDDTIANDLAKPSDAPADRKYELRYTHFGVLFSISRRTPLVTAVNLDGKNAVRIKRGNDKWFFDLRIPKEIQLGQAAYGDPQIDRGHMVRREDPNWGELAEQANADTFHYTNAALQHSSLNQGKSLWQGLENYILDSARTEGFKACVFTGPILRDTDPALAPSNERVPLEFWKIVVMPTPGGGLHATGYLLSQGDLIRKLLEDRRRDESVEGFVLGPYRTFQVAIAHLEAETGLQFAALRGADPLEKAATTEAPLANRPAYRPLETEADIIL